MRALVTGGAGFIGSHLVDALVGRGDDVLVLDDLSTGRRENLAAALEAGAALAEVGVTDRDAVEAAFADHRPEQVFHLAAQIDVRVSVADPVFDLGVNVGGTINVLERCRDHGVARLIFASTGGAIYGEGDGRELPLGEDADCLPDAPYGQSKLAAEGYLSLYRRQHGVAGISLRLGNVYGPRQDPHGEAGVVAMFCGGLLGERELRVFGDGHQTRDYVYVGDVVTALLAATNARGAGPYNIGTGVETSVLDLGASLAAAFGTAFEPELAPARPGEVQRIAIDPARAAADLGWRAEADLDHGLRLTLDSFATGRPRAGR
ncbi:MAG: NAD-dependent epimerase/dehydratase family protein [Solirubrobacterales bacterium]